MPTIIKIFIFRAAVAAAMYCGLGGSLLIHLIVGKEGPSEIRLFLYAIPWAMAITIVYLCDKVYDIDEKLDIISGQLSRLNEEKGGS